MQAETADKTAGRGVWGTARRLRDQWLLLLFLAGALVWLRDAGERLGQVPGDLAAQRRQLAALVQGVARIERRLAPEEPAGQGAVLAFPGDRHAIEDGPAGAWTVARLRPARPLRSDCRAGRVDVWVVDAEGRWFSVETSLGPLPRLTGDTDLAFGVRIPADAAPGRAQALVQLTHECGTHREVQIAPRLQFRVQG